MKKSIRVLFALIALFGAVNCFLLEPALAAQEETLCVVPDGCDECFVCCSFHHQAVPSTDVPLSHPRKESVFIEVSSVIRFDSPSFSIFHPPLAV